MLPCVRIFRKTVNSYHVKTFRDAMEEVASGRADYAVLPIENSTAGYCDGYLRPSDGISVVYRRGAGRESGACAAWNAGALLWMRLEQSILTHRRWHSVKNIWKSIRTGKRKTENTAGAAKKGQRR